MTSQPAALPAEEQPEQCPECETTTFDYDPNHDDGISMGPAWLCTGCKWGEWILSPKACVKCRQTFDPADTAFDGRARSGETPFCRRCVDRCHESTDAFHACAICR